MSYWLIEGLGNPSKSVFVFTFVRRQSVQKVSSVVTLLLCHEPLLLTQTSSPRTFKTLFDYSLNEDVTSAIALVFGAMLVCRNRYKRREVNAILGTWAVT